MDLLPHYALGGVLHMLGTLFAAGEEGNRVDIKAFFMNQRGYLITGLIAGIIGGYALIGGGLETMIPGIGPIENALGALLAGWTVISASKKIIGIANKKAA